MRSAIFFIATGLGSLAFELSITFYPQKLMQYAWLTTWVWFACGVAWILWFVSHPKLIRSLLGPRKAMVPSAEPPTNSAELHPSISPVISPVFNNYNSVPQPPAKALGTEPAERLPVHVEFAPWEGKMERMFLAVTNRGAKQTFHAQCRILARRNDPNPPHLMTLDLQWQHSDRE